MADQNLDWDEFMQSVDDLFGSPEDNPELRPSRPPEGRPVPRTPKKKKKKSSTLPLIAAGAAAALVLTAALVILFMLLLPGTPEGRTPEDLRAGSVMLGGMTYREAVRTMNAAMDGSITIDLGVGEPLVLSYADAHASLDTDRLVRDALAAPGGQIDPADYMTFDEGAVRSILTARAGELSAGRTAPAFGPAEPLPDLSTGSFDPDTPLPAYTIYTGTAGSRLDTDGLYTLAAASLTGFTGSIDGSALVQSDIPELPTADEIKARIVSEPVNDSLDASGNPVHGSYGISLDEAALEEALASAAGGQTITIPLTATAPEILGMEVYFTDMLGFCKTHHTPDEQRNVNLALACKAINGVVLQPGEVFSYNDTVGPRTEAAGFQSAPVYSGVELVPDIGGGVCQVSSTLYLCSLYAGLETVERVNHGLPVNYMPLGLDATVSYGVVDMKIANPYDTPIRIIAETDDTYVYVWIMGLETRDYTVKMRYSAGEYAAVAREVHFDRETGAQLDTEQDIKARPAIRSGYLNTVTSLYGIIGSGDEYIYTNVKPQEMVWPSEETMADARTNKAPNRFAQAAPTP